MSVAWREESHQLHGRLSVPDMTILAFQFCLLSLIAPLRAHSERRVPCKRLFVFRVCCSVMPGTSEPAATERKYLNAGLTWEDPEQEEEDQRAWQHMKAAWLATCLPAGECSAVGEWSAALMPTVRRVKRWPDVTLEQALAV